MSKSDDPSLFRIFPRPSSWLLVSHRGSPSQCQAKLFTTAISRCPFSAAIIVNHRGQIGKKSGIRATNATPRYTMSSCMLMYIFLLLLDAGQKPICESRKRWSNSVAAPWLVLCGRRLSPRISEASNTLLPLLLLLLSAAGCCCGEHGSDRGTLQRRCYTALSAHAVIRT